jgi:hypothetical protein
MNLCCPLLMVDCVLNVFDTRAETRFRLSAKWTSSFKLAGASVQSTTGSRCVRISGSNAGYTMFRSSVKSTGYPLYSPVSPLLPPSPRASPCAITLQLDYTSILSSFISSSTALFASSVFLLVFNLYLPAFKPQCSCS